MENFAKHQDQMRSYMEETFGRFFPIGQFEDMTRQNMALFTRAATIFRPFANNDPNAPAEPQSPSPPSTAAPERVASSNEVKELRQKMETLQHQLDELNRTQKTKGRD
jgi:polyhydroxyalkanoate synthesis regulator protein